MDKPVKILATICARGASKGLPGKNIRPLLGKPLIAYTIEQALSSGLFEHVVVSTDSNEIAVIAKQHGAEVPFLRPKELATDVSSKLPAIRHVLVESEKLFNKKFDVIVDLDATSPLRVIDDIKNCINLLFENDTPNVITAMLARRSPYFNLIEIDSNGHVNLSKKASKPITCRQNSPKCYDMNASIYVWKRDVLLENDSIFLENTALYVMPMERSIDIDYEVEFNFVEFLAGMREDFKNDKQ